ncbi:MAG TPA: acetyl-CoA hydrolase/transferase C-terminal domain-containing protein [Terriglobales bacterium]|nr:acetyl-CoA hydrolase/transferase C-terminal domain-containing protein [Terriglobales bacterium]
MSWHVNYKRKLMTAGDAVRCVESGMRVYIHPGCAEPEVLVEALMERAPFVRDVEIIHLMTMGTAPYVKPEMAGHFRHNAMFIGGNCREAVNDGRADYTPVFLSEIEALMENGQLRPDVALIQVSMPDAHGFCSLGVGVDTTMTAARCAKFTVAQVNDQMPRTYGDSFLHVDQIDAFVETSRPLCETPKVEITATHRAIAKHVATLIEDGSTLQTGIGGIPDAVMPFLTDRQDLGVHSELVGDGIIALMEAGVVTGRRKTLLPRKVVVSFVLGSKRLFDYVNENPAFEFRPNAFTNDPLQIARNEKMIAINSALQVDLTGQVCADSIGTYFYSGIGGQVDFLRGASRAKGGKPIIALPSTAKNDTVSRIAPMLDPGAGVVTSRGLIRYVVTEYGVAYLHGKTIRERAQALISIAHPKFRDQLFEYCERTKWLQKNHVAPVGVG